MPLNQDPYDAFFQGNVAKDPYDAFFQPGIEPEPVEPDEGGVLDAAGNVVQGMGERTLSLLGNLVGFAETGGENLEQAAGVMDWVPQLGGISYDDQGLRYLNPREWEDYNAGGGEKVLRNVQESLDNADLGYEPGTTWEDFKQAEGFFDSTTELAAFGLETGLVSIPDMVAAVGNLPAYFTARTEEISQERAANQGRDEPNAEDVSIGAVSTAIISAMERFGAEQVFGAFIRGGSAPTKILKAAAGEAGTEAIQEPIEMLGETYGTPVEEAMSPDEYQSALLERSAQGAAGGFFGGGAIATPGALLTSGEPAPVPDDPNPGPVKSIEENADAITRELEATSDGAMEAQVAGETQQIEERETEQIEAALQEDEAEFEIHPTFFHAERARRQLGETDLEPVLNADGTYTLRDPETADYLRTAAEQDPNWGNYPRTGEQKQEIREGEQEQVSGETPVDVPVDAELASVAQPGSQTVASVIEARETEQAQVATETPLDIPDDALTRSLQETPPEVTAKNLTPAAEPVVEPQPDTKPVVEPEAAPEKAQSPSLLDMAGQISGEQLAEQANEAATSPDNDLPAPSEAQIEAGNYKKGHISYDGLKISIENPAGSVRRPEWPALSHHYGDIKLTEGADGDPVDVFINKDNESTDTPAFIINQFDQKTGKFDETKVMLGFNTEAEARQGYLDNYGKGFKAPEVIPQLTMDELKTWLREGDTKAPYGEFKPVPTKSDKPAQKVKKVSKNKEPDPGTDLSAPKTDARTEDQKIADIAIERYRDKETALNYLRGRFDRNIPPEVSDRVERAFGEETKLQVLDEVPNLGSIRASLTNWEEVPGIQQIPISEFDSDPKDLFYASDDRKRVRDLAAEIRNSGEIKPLIVVQDAEGYYVLEGGHRLGALHELGEKTIPALVVKDLDSLSESESKPTIDDVLTASMRGAPESKPLSEVELTAELDDQQITHTAEYWLGAIDDRLRAIAKLRGCA